MARDDKPRPSLRCIYITALHIRPNNAGIRWKLTGISSTPTVIYTNPAMQGFICSCETRSSGRTMRGRDHLVTCSALGRRVAEWQGVGFLRTLGFGVGFFIRLRNSNWIILTSPSQLRSPNSCLLKWIPLIATKLATLSLKNLAS